MKGRNKGYKSMVKGQRIRDNGLGKSPKLNLTLKTSFCPVLKLWKSISRKLEKNVMVTS